MLGHIVFNRRLAVIDKRRAEPFDNRLLPGRTRGKNFCAKSAGDLHRDMANATGAAMNQYRLPGSNARPVHQAFPSRNKHQRQSGSLPHAQIVRLASQQSRIDRRVFGQRTLNTANTGGHGIHLVPR
ncbi:hypothetical protein D3C71_1399280 [compost metagenome]